MTGSRGMAQDKNEQSSLSCRLEKRRESMHASANPGIHGPSARKEQSEEIMNRLNCSRHRGRGCHALTRVEVLALVGVLALLALVVLPTRANTRSRSARVICANNLRQIGTAFHLWGNDHDDTLPQEVAPAQGGTMGHSLAPNVWLHLSWISNEVVSPRIFFCPTDTGQAASDFTANRVGGYLHLNFQNFASSYFLAYVGRPFANPQNATIAGDRNVSTDGPVGCSRFNRALTIFVPLQPGSARWTAGLHGDGGNVLTWDGQVQQADSPGLRRLLDLPGTDNSAKHIITPR
jgi:prepilin-type processing-associated H-X9-DG protein